MFPNALVDTLTHSNTECIVLRVLFCHTGRQDSSGLRMYYTSELRRHNVGTLTTGLTVSIDYKIPPGATQFHTYGTCNTSLFSKVRSLFD